jgi:hypothetical protein
MNTLYPEIIDEICLRLSIPTLNAFIRTHKIFYSHRTSLKNKLLDECQLSKICNDAVLEIVPYIITNNIQCRILIIGQTDSATNDDLLLQKISNNSNIIILPEPEQAVILKDSKYINFRILIKNGIHYSYQIEDIRNVSEFISQCDTLFDIPNNLNNMTLQILFYFEIFTDLTGEVIEKFKIHMKEAHHDINFMVSNTDGTTYITIGSCQATNLTDIVTTHKHVLSLLQII